MGWGGGMGLEGGGRRGFVAWLGLCWGRLGGFRCDGAACVAVELLYFPDARLPI